MIEKGCSLRRQSAYTTPHTKPSNFSENEINSLIVDQKKETPVMHHHSFFFPSSPIFHFSVILGQGLSIEKRWKKQNKMWNGVNQSKNGSITLVLSTNAKCNIHCLIHNCHQREIYTQKTRPPSPPFFSTRKITWWQEKKLCLVTLCCFQEEDCFTPVSNVLTYILCQLFVRSVCSEDRLKTWKHNFTLTLSLNTQSSCAGFKFSRLRRRMAWCNVNIMKGRLYPCTWL